MNPLTALRLAAQRASGAHAMLQTPGRLNEALEAAKHARLHLDAAIIELEKLTRLPASVPR